MKETSKMLGLLISYVLLMTGRINADPDCTASLQETERAANAVEFKLYRIQTDEWNAGDNSAKVSVQVSDQANAYCAANPGACGLETCCSAEFKDLSVGVVSGYPKNLKKDMKLKIYLDFPSALNASGTRQCVVGAGVVREIIGTVRQGIFDDTGSWITYVDTEFYGIPPDNQLNAIIIPIACVVVLAIIIAALVLHFWNKRREAVARRQKIIEQRKKNKTAKVTPTYRTENIPKEGEIADQPKSEKPKRKDEMYMENLRKKNSSGLKTVSIHSEDSAIKLDNEPRQRKTYAYERDESEGATGIGRPTGHLRPLEKEPITDDSQVEPEKKKKKKKKHKRHREPEVYQNAGYDSTGVGDRQPY